MITAADLIAKFQQAIDEKWGYIYYMTHEKWSESKQKSYDKARASDPNAQNSIRYGPKWYGHWVTDCSGLFAWAFSSLGGKMYHGSDTMYRKWCTEHGELSKGKRTDGKTLKPGSAVFCYNGSKYTHVGLFIGGTTVIEAAGAQKGVCTSKVTDSKWDAWGELTGVDYSKASEIPVPDPEPEKEKLMKRGSKGADVKKLQQRLLELGYKLPKYGADGDFGSETESAVKQFQRDWGLTADGIVGTDTQKMLDSVPIKAKEYSVTVKGLTLSQAKALCDMYPGKSSYKEMG